MRQPPQDAGNAHRRPRLRSAKNAAFNKRLTDSEAPGENLSDALLHPESEKQCSVLGCVVNYNNPKSSLQSLKSVSADRRGTRGNSAEGASPWSVCHQCFASKTTWIPLKTIDGCPHERPVWPCPCLPWGAASGHRGGNARAGEGGRGLREPVQGHGPPPSPLPSVRGGRLGSSSNHNKMPRPGRLKQREFLPPQSWRLHPGVGRLGPPKASLHGTWTAASFPCPHVTAPLCPSVS